MSDESYYDKAEAQITQLRGEVDAANNRCAVTLVEVSRLLVRLADTERAMDDQAQALVVALDAREKAEAERDEALKSRDGMHAAMCDQVDRAELLEVSLREIETTAFIDVDEDEDVCAWCGTGKTSHRPGRDGARNCPVNVARAALSPAPGEGE
jgi:phage-related tail protein